MRKIIPILAALLIIVSVSTIYAYSKKVDTKYAIEFARVFGSYDISKVDKYLNDDTLITYDGNTQAYSELRNNVVDAFEEKAFEMLDGSSYGHGDDLFVDGIQEIGIQAYVTSDEYSSEFISMELERKNFISYKIKSLASNDDFFGYLFFGKPSHQ